MDFQTAQIPDNVIKVEGKANSFQWRTNLKTFVSRFFKNNDDYESVIFYTFYYKKKNGVLPKDHHNNCCNQRETRLKNKWFITNTLKSIGFSRDTIKYGFCILFDTYNNVNYPMEIGFQKGKIGTCSKCKRKFFETEGLGFHLCKRHEFEYNQEKGGHNPHPTVPRPNIKPSGQKVFKGNNNENQKNSG